MSKGNRKRRREKGLLPEPAKCSAHTQSGDPCKNAPINGAKVCRVHGGSAPQVKAKALERLVAASNSAAAKLVQLMQSPDVPYAIQLKAAEAILDRVGIGPKLELEIEAPWQGIIMGIVAEVSDEQIDRALPYLTGEQELEMPDPKELAGSKDYVVQGELVKSSDDRVPFTAPTPSLPPPPTPRHRKEPPAGPRIRGGRYTND